jgi:hypothetical protein
MRAPVEDSPGEVAEWSNVPDSKSGVALYATVGSNPTLSAITLEFKWVPQPDHNTKPARNAVCRSRVESDDPYIALS